MAATLEADVERPALLGNHALLALHLVTQRADPVHRGRCFVVALVSVVVDSKSFVAAPGSEVHDSTLKKITKASLVKKIFQSNSIKGWN